MSVSVHHRRSPYPRVAGAAWMTVVAMTLAASPPLFVRAAGKDDKAAKDKLRQPDRIELWVPSKALEEVLRRHPDAVLLTREEYEALIRDAGKLSPDAPIEAPPVGAVIESIRLSGTAKPGQSLLSLKGELVVKALAKGWNAARLELPWKTVGRLRIGGGVLVEHPPPVKQQATDPSLPLIILAKGPGEYRIQFECSAAVSRGSSPDEGLLFYRQTRTPALLELELPAGSTLSQGPPAESSGDKHRFLLGGEGSGQSVIAWRQPPPAGLPARVSGLALRGACRIGETDITATYDAVLASNATDAPVREVSFAVSPPQTSVVAVEGSQMEAWSQDGSVLTVRFAIASRSPQLRIELRVPFALPEKDSMKLELPTVQLDGSHHAPVVTAVATDEGVELLELLASRTPAAHIAEWDARSGKAAAVIRKAVPRIVVDADARIFAARDVVEIERTVNVTTDRPADHLRVNIPTDEELLDVAWAAGPKFEWRRAGQTVDVEWSQALDARTAGRFVITSRIKLAAVAVAQPGGAQAVQLITIENLVIDDAKKLAGYVALDSDPMWRLSVAETNGLEDRDVRLTPVKGRMAWFNLRNFKLTLEARRRESKIDAEVTAYALPRANSVEIEGQVSLDIAGAPLRQIEVRLAKESAKLLRFTSPLIAEQMLDESTGTWKLTLAKETTGRVNLRFRMTMAAASVREARPGAATLPNNPPQQAPSNVSRSETATLSATLPRIEIPSARRFRGSWVVEANTDTELSFETKALQPLDVMRVPAVEGYAPRHRLVAAFAYGPGEHSLAITATRHPHSELAALFVTQLHLASALSRDGASKHEASIQLRHSGEQFAHLRLPARAQLLSALVDGRAVKPVRAAGDAIAIPLPGGSVNRDAVSVRLVYEQVDDSWDESGLHRLEPITILGNAPILATTWTVHVPNGFSYRKVDTGMEQSGTYEAESVVENLDPFEWLTPRFAVVRERMERVAIRDDRVAGRAGEMPVDAFAAAPARKDYVSEKLNQIVFPKIEFREAELEDIIEFIRIKARDLDHSERDSEKKGIGLELRPSGDSKASPITLSLTNVPLSEALRYATELAGMKYRIENGKIIVEPITETTVEQITRVYEAPPNLLAVGGGAGAATSPPASDNERVLKMLKEQGIAFPEGASVAFDRTTGRLVVKNTLTNLDLVSAFVQSVGIQEVRGGEGVEAAGKIGLLPLDLDLPKSGRILRFTGSQAPESLELRYVSWERQMRWAMGMMAIGALVFAAWGSRRPWLRTLLALVLLSAGARLIAENWLPLANAVLFGWLAALGLWVVWRLFAGIEKRFAGGHRHAEVA